jgi:hypothetical protein
MTFAQTGCSETLAWPSACSGFVLSIWLRSGGFLYLASASYADCPISNKWRSLETKAVVHDVVENGAELIAESHAKIDLIRTRPLESSQQDLLISEGRSAQKDLVTNAIDATTDVEAKPTKDAHAHTSTEFNPVLLEVIEKGGRHQREAGVTPGLPLKESEL